MRNAFHVSSRQGLIGYELTRCAYVKRDCLRASNLHSINVEMIQTFSPIDCHGWQFQTPRGTDERAAASQDLLKGVSYLAVGVHEAPFLAEATGDVQGHVCMARGYGLLTQTATKVFQDCLPAGFDRVGRHIWAGMTAVGPRAVSISPV